MNSFRLALTLVLVSSAALPAATPARRAPNIVFIMADDLGYGDLGAFGQKKIRTPHIDRLAVEGSRFTEYYAGAAVCAPTRCCLMTGRHTGHGTIRDNSGVVRDASGAEKSSRIPLRPEDQTVAELLSRAGYATGIVGKWGLGEDKTTGVPNRQGFDFWLGYLNQDHAEFYYTDTLFRNEEAFTIEPNKNDAHGVYSNDLFTDEALRFISANRSRPFFLYAAYTIPHSLLTVPEDSLREYDSAFPDDPPLVGGKDRVARPRATFAAMVTRLDSYVGRIMARLRDLGIDDNTIVFFCSDNGAPPRNGLATFFGSGGPLKGWKGSMNEGGLRAPMIVRWPGRVPAGRVNDAPWAGWDILPTLAELAGVTQVPEGIDGISFLPALLGGTAPAHDYFYWENRGQRKDLAQAVRIGNFKALRPGLDAPIEVYDVRADPGETRDLAATKPEVVTRARELFRTARTSNENYPTNLDGTGAPEPAKGRAKAKKR